MAQLEFQDLPISPWLGLDSDELVKTMNQEVRQTSFKERWKYTSAKKAFNLNLEAMERMPDFGGSTQPGVTISDKPNLRVLRLTSHKIINEKILMISKAKSPVSIEITESLEEPLEITSSVAVLRFSSSYRTAYHAKSTSTLKEQKINTRPFGSSSDRILRLPIPGNP